MVNSCSNCKSLSNTVWMWVAQYFVESAISEIHCCDVRVLNFFIFAAFRWVIIVYYESVVNKDESIMCCWTAAKVAFKLLHERGTRSVRAYADATWRRPMNLGEDIVLSLIEVKSDQTCTAKKLATLVEVISDSCKSWLPGEHPGNNNPPETL